MVDGFNGLLTATVFLPAAGALVLLLLVRGDKNVRNFAVLIVLADLVLSLLVFGFFDRADGADRFQFVDQITCSRLGARGRFVTGKMHCHEIITKLKTFCRLIVLSSPSTGTEGSATC